MSSIPYDKLNIPDMLRRNCDPASPKPMRLATAKAALPIAPEALLGLCTVLAGDPDKDIHDAAMETLRKLPNVVSLLNQRTHPKVLELLANLRSDLDERILTIRNGNDATTLLIATRADARICEMLCSNHERLLMTPDVLLRLHANEACSEVDFERANAFLRMEGCAPALPGPRGQKPEPAPEIKATPTKSPEAPKAPPKPVAKAPPPPAPVFDLEAEIEAALAGKASPMLLAKQKLEMFNLDSYDVTDSPLPGFSFDFKEDADFSMDLTNDAGEGQEPDNEKKASIAKQIADMPPGKKIKLAYVGNKEVRNILIRDRNKQVALAVCKSGRMSDAEVLAHAGNRNLGAEVLREIGTNGEWMRKYPVKVAMVNNPRCPPSIAVGLVNQLQAKDLSALGRNKNVSAVIFQLAQKMAKQKGG